MATINWKVLGQAVMTGTPASIYTAPTSTQAAVHAAQVWNPTAAPVTVDVYIVPPAGSAVDGTHVDRVIVPATSSWPIYGLINQKLTAGYQLFAAGNGATITVTGAESVPTT